MRKIRNLLRNGVDVKAFNGVDVVQTVAAVEGLHAVLMLLCFNHELGSGTVINGHKHKFTILENSDLRGEIGGILGEGGLHYGDALIQLFLELAVDSLRIVIACAVQNSNGLTLVVCVHIFGRCRTLVAIGEAHLVSVTPLGDVVIRG